MQVFIKQENDNELHLQGYGIVFDSIDLHGEKFTKETNFFIEGINSVPVLWSHNLKEIKGILGKATISQIDDVGVLFDIIIDRSNRYMQLVKKLVETGRVGLSTGALPQTAEKEGNVIKSWQIGEISLTETPAEFLTLSLEEVKHFADMLNEVSSESSDESYKLEELNQTEKAEIEFENIEIIGEQKMENIETPQVENAYEKTMKALEEKLEKVMGILESTPAGKAGYVTSDGGKADPTIKSFGDYLLAIRRGDEVRLKNIYGAMKDLGESPGTAGGYLVPTEYGSQLIQAAAFNNPIYSKVNKVPVARESGTYPALDQYFTPTAGAGNTAYAAGVAPSFTAAGAEFSETQPTFSTLQWRLNKMGGVTEVENELIEDSPFAIEALLRGLFQVAISARNERNILRGTGVGEPLGILNSPVAVGISDNTTGKFKWEDVGAMYARFKGMGGSPVWIVHPSVWPQIMTMNNSSVVVQQSNLGGAPSNMINGFEVVTSEHVPQLGNNGAVILADLSAYVMFEKAGLSISYSEHVGFKRDVGVWKFRIRNDGKPWLQAPITLADPQGSYTVSPFIYIVND